MWASLLCGFDVERATPSASASGYAQLSAIDDVEDVWVLNGQLSYAHRPLQVMGGPILVENLASMHLAGGWQFFPGWTLRTQWTSSWVPGWRHNRKHVGGHLRDPVVELQAVPLRGMLWGAGWDVGASAAVRLPNLWLPNLGEGDAGASVGGVARVRPTSWLRFDAEARAWWTTSTQTGWEANAGVRFSPLAWLSVPIELTHRGYLQPGQEVVLNHPTEVRAGVVTTWNDVQWGVHASTSVFPGVGAPLARLQVSIRWAPKFMRSKPAQSLPSSTAPAPPQPLQKRVRLLDASRRPLAGAIDANGVPCVATATAGVFVCELSTPGTALKLVGREHRHLSTTWTGHVDDMPDELILLRQVTTPLSAPPRNADHKLLASTSVYFATNNDALDVNARRRLRALRLQPGCPEGRVFLRGHADRRGGDVDNLNLSARRVRSVRLWFEQRGCSIDHVESFGERRPLVDGASDAELRPNRRVDVLVVGPTVREAAPAFAERTRERPSVVHVGDTGVGKAVAISTNHKEDPP